ncbi:alpha-amylase [Streptococcaceae bacterium ESL0729]|nr:alpha-amylase [Streptococcaceae bacterium ESL0729]
MNKRNMVIFQAFEWYLPSDGKHWTNLAEKAYELKKLGFSAVWFPPASKASGGKDDVGYGVYDRYDLGEFEQKGTVLTKYGSKEDYLAAIRAIHDFDMEVYADIVFNQMLGADETEVVPAAIYDSNNRNRELSPDENIEAWTKFTFPGRAGKYNDYIWTWKNFSGVDYDARTKTHAIFNIDNKGWNSEVDRENGNYDYLMGCDLDMSYDETIEQLDEWGRWHLELTGVDGYRLDAVKHIEFDYYVDWLLKRRSEKGIHMFVVGEYWSADLSRLTDYLNSSGNIIRLFDVPLHYNLYNAANSNGSYDMRNILKGTLIENHEDFSVTFVDNHDTQPGQSLASWVGGWFKLHAYALILLRKQGVPVVFWGDLYGIPSQGINPVGPGLESLLKLRNKIDFGNQVDYFDDPNCISWVLTGDFNEDYSGIVVIMTNGASSQKTVTVSALHRDKVFVDILKNNDSRVTLDRDGKGTFPINGGQVSVYVQEDLAKEL